MTDNGTDTLLFGKTKNNEKICVIDSSVYPYFYIQPLKDEKEVIQLLEKGINGNKPISIKKVEKIHFGKKINLMKVELKWPSLIKDWREELSKWNKMNIFEADILFTRRYLIDKEIIPMILTDAEGDFADSKYKIPCFRAKSIEQKSTESLNSENLDVLAFDIETYGYLGHKINPEKNPILMMGLYGEKTVNGKKQSLKKVITWKKIQNAPDYVEFVEGEAELLTKFIEHVEKYSPDVLTGYFSDGFDLPYIETRCRKYKINLNLGVDNTTLSAKGDGIKITGIVHIDAYKFVTKIFKTALETDTYSLDEVAKEVLGKEKHKVNLDELPEAWDNADKPEASAKLVQFTEYNYQDVLITYELVKKIFPNLEEIAKIIALPYDDVNRMAFSQLVEWYIIKQTVKANQLIPNRPTSQEQGNRQLQRFQGAFVFSPQPGLYDDIVVFDFRSLYPTIIASHNIGPDTINCDCCQDTAEKVPLEGATLWFCKKVKGFLPSVIEDLISRRARVKELLKQNNNKVDQKENKDQLLQARSDTLKLLANSFYGYLGFFGARWYNFNCGQSVTAYGRYYVNKLIKQVQDYGFGVCYGDTDSCFILLKDKSKEDARKFAEEINKNLPGSMELEYEGYYPRGIFVSAKSSGFGAKKKYALLKEDGFFKIKGFEAIRRNWSEIAQEVQEKVIEIILSDSDKERAKEEATKYVRDIVSKVKSKQIIKDKMIISMKLQKPLEEYDAIGPHVTIARQLQSKGINVGVGSLIQYIITEGKGIKEAIRDKAKLPEQTKDTEYDANYYINNQIVPTVESIFEVVGISKQELLEGKTQSKLGEFF